MADLTIGEVGVILQVQLLALNTAANPPTTTPLDLTGATVTLSYVITNQNAPPQSPLTVRNMLIFDAPNGIVQYTFQSGDLVRPPNMAKFGAFRYSIKATYLGGNILVTAYDGILSIKDDSQL